MSTMSHMKLRTIKEICQKRVVSESLFLHQNFTLYLFLIPCIRTYPTTHRRDNTSSAAGIPGQWPVKLSLPPGPTDDHSAHYAREEHREETLPRAVYWSLAEGEGSGQGLPSQARDVLLCGNGILSRMYT